MNTQLTPEQKYDLITKDFLERDGDTFVRIRTTDRLGWEDTLPKDSAYSEAILSPKSERELLKNACALARQMITAMNTPFKVDIVINNKNSCTDSKKVFIATEVFDDETIPLAKRLDTFLGLAIHEGSHLLYTDFEYSRNSKNNNRVIHDIWNILEDEMIERHLGEDKPGLANFLKATKYYYFGRYQKETQTNTEQSKAVRLLNTVLSMVRYPAALKPENVKEFADPLLEIRTLINNYPTNTDGCFKKAVEIYEIIKKYMTDEEQQSLEQEQNSSQNQNSSNSNKQRQETGQNKQNTLSDKDIESLLSKALDAIEKISGDPDKKETEEKMCKAALKNGRIIADECDGKLEIGKTQNTVLLKREDNKNKYEQSLARIKRYIPATATALRQNSTTYQFIIPGQRHGKLDTNKLADARQGIQTVYTKRGKVTTDETNLILVIDESGSMREKRETLARDTAILISEAIGKIHNINVNIYGYSTAYVNSVDRNVIYPYRESNKKFNKYSLGSISSYGGTPTKQAILECAERCQNKGKNKTLMFVISDGEASEGPTSVRKVVDKIKKDNIQVVGISIASTLSQDSLKKMYDHYIKVNDISTLAKDLGQTIKNALLKTNSRQLK